MFWTSRTFWPLLVATRLPLPVSVLYRKFREVWTCGFRDMRTDRQTDGGHADCKTSLLYRGLTNYELEMWANAQPDGRPAEYR